MEKYNFNIDLKEKNISVEVPSSIFPVPVILRAVYHFIEEAKIIVDKSKQDKEVVLVTFILDKDKTEEKKLEEIAYEFNLQLISSFLEEVESDRHAELRQTLMKAALFSKDTSPRSPQQPRPSSEKDQSQSPKN